MFMRADGKLAWPINYFSHSGQSGPLRLEEPSKVMRDMVTDHHDKLTHTHTLVRWTQ